MRGIGRIASTTRRNIFGVSGVIDDVKAQWDKAIADFQAQRIELDNAETALYDVYPSIADAEDLAEYQRLLDSVIARKTAMDAIADAVTTISDWFSSAGDFFGLSGVARRRGALGNLGIALPAFPISIGVLLALIAAAAAVVASVSSFVTYIIAKRDRMNASQSYIEARTQELTQGGMSIEAASAQAYNEANEIASNQAKDESGHNFGLTIERTALYAAIAAVAIFVVPRLIGVSHGR